MNKFFMTLALASGLATTHHTHTAAEATVSAISAEQLSLNAQLLQALQACTQLDTDKSALIDSVKNLLAQKADPNAVDSNGNTALHWAIKPYVFHRPERINAEGRYIRPCSEPCFCYGNVQNLILAGANANAKNSDNETPAECLTTMSILEKNRNYTGRYFCVIHDLQKAIAEKKARDAQAQQNQQDPE